MPWCGACGPGWESQQTCWWEPEKRGEERNLGEVVFEGTPTHDDTTVMNGTQICEWATRRMILDGLQKLMHEPIKFFGQSPTSACTETPGTKKFARETRLQW